MDFVDDELSGKLRADFLSHSEVCSDCRRELSEVQQVRKLLANLPPVAVSTEFDFRLKASLRLEDSHLRNPMYRFKRFLKDNMATVVAVPAAAVLLVSGVFYSQDFFRGGAPVGQVVEKEVPSVQTEAPPAVEYAPGTEDVNYVLESLDQDSFSVEVTTNGQPGVLRQVDEPALKTVSLINF